jgi:hypothetical protein
MASKRNEYGEGNYEATRQYNRATKKFVESGRVERAARDAAPRSAEEATEMKRAEQAALLRAKGVPLERGPSSPSTDSTASGTTSRRAARRSGAGDTAAPADDDDDGNR